MILSNLSVRSPRGVMVSVLNRVIVVSELELQS